MAPTVLAGAVVGQGSDRHRSFDDRPAGLVRPDDAPVRAADERVRGPGGVYTVTAGEIREARYEGVPGGSFRYGMHVYNPGPYSVELIDINPTRSFGSPFRVEAIRVAPAPQVDGHPWLDSTDFVPITLGPHDERLIWITGHVADCGPPNPGEVGLPANREEVGGDMAHHVPGARRDPSPGSTAFCALCRCRVQGRPRDLQEPAMTQTRADLTDYRLDVSSRLVDLNRRDRMALLAEPSYCNRAALDQEQAP